MRCGPNEWWKWEFKPHENEIFLARINCIRAASVIVNVIEWMREWTMIRYIELDFEMFVFVCLDASCISMVFIAVACSRCKRNASNWKLIEFSLRNLHFFFIFTRNNKLNRKFLVSIMFIGNLPANQIESDRYYSL